MKQIDIEISREFEELNKNNALTYLMEEILKTEFKSVEFKNMYNDLKKISDGHADSFFILEYSYKAAESGIRY